MRRGAGRQVDYILASQRFVLYNRPRALPCCHAAARLVALTNHNTGIGAWNPEKIGSRPWHFGKAGTPLVDVAKPNLFNWCQSPRAELYGMLQTVVARTKKHISMVHPYTMLILH
jgi:hypothetical protein